MSDNDAMRCAIGLALLATCLGAACTEDDVDQCEEYCSAAQECAEASHQMMSPGECTRECDDSMERYESIGCEKQFRDYLSCISHLHCADWQEVSQYCAAEIDWLDGCVGGAS
ncbi:MAG: hypothetical protein R6V85_04785 [Polyangia bacterium]